MYFYNQFLKLFKNHENLSLGFVGRGYDFSVSILKQQNLYNAEKLILNIPNKDSNFQLKNGMEELLRGSRKLSKEDKIIIDQESIRFEVKTKLHNINFSKHSISYSEEKEILSIITTIELSQLGKNAQITNGDDFQKKSNLMTYENFNFIYENINLDEKEILTLFELKFDFKIENDQNYYKIVQSLIEVNNYIKQLLNKPQCKPEGIFI